MKVAVTSRSVEVGWTVDGYHRWPDATGERAYLADRHRHRFNMTLAAPVDHDDRALEFHDLLDWCHARYEHGMDFGSLSCEAIASALAAEALVLWHLPWCEVTVSEDGYVTARIRVEET